MDDETWFRLTEHTRLSPEAVLTFKGRRLSRPEKAVLLNTGDDRFLLAFAGLPKEGQIAVRLRYGNDTLKWYRENSDA